MEELDTFYISLILALLLWSGVGVLLFRQRHRFAHKKAAFLIVWNLFISLWVLSMFIAAGKTYYRFGVDTTDSFTTDSFGLNKLSQRWLHRHYQLNNFKARDNKDYQLRKPAGKKRITFIGDSFTAGHGIKQVDDRFPNLIRQSNPNLEVHVLNDIAYLPPHTEIIYQRIYQYESQLGYLGSNSYFSDEWEKQAGILAEIAGKVHTRGGKLMVVTFPFLHETKEADDFQPIHARLDAFWSGLQVPHLDLKEVFAPYAEEDLTVNPYDAHPNERAHEIAAKAIADFLYRHF